MNIIWMLTMNVNKIWEFAYLNIIYMMYIFQAFKDNETWYNLWSIYHFYQAKLYLKHKELAAKWGGALIRSFAGIAKWSRIPKIQAIIVCFSISSFWESAQTETVQNRKGGEFWLLAAADCRIGGACVPCAALKSKRISKALGKAQELSFHALPPHPICMTRHHQSTIHPLEESLTCCLLPFSSLILSPLHPIKHLILPFIQTIIQKFKPSYSSIHSNHLIPPLVK